MSTRGELEKRKVLTLSADILNTLASILAKSDILEYRQINTDNMGFFFFAKMRPRPIR